MESLKALTGSTTVSSQEPPAGGFVGRFGLDPWLLLAQAVNFLIVLVILRQFVFRPLLRVIRERQGRIDRGLQDAERATELRSATEAERRQRLAGAAAEAARKLRGAEEEANRLRESILRTAKGEAEAMHDQAEQDATRLKAEALGAAASEAGDLVVDALEKVLQEKLSSPERSAYRETALRALKAAP